MTDWPRDQFASDADYQWAITHTYQRPAQILGREYAWFTDSNGRLELVGPLESADEAT